MGSRTLLPAMVGMTAETTDRGRTEDKRAGILALAGMAEAEIKHQRSNF
jgi:hypothetical protein